jgi:thiol-disulfide isomerase/thioredoxin
MTIDCASIFYFRFGSTLAPRAHPIAMVAIAADLLVLTKLHLIMRFAILLLLCLPLLSLAYAPVNHNDTGGIHFIENLSWDQVKDKAKKEKRYIFVDCYATWCGPCKRMDSEVYSDKKVGKEMNKIFISLKVQMDSTEFDSDQVRTHYKDAKDIESAFKITVYPTLLFLSPSGEIVYRAVGYKNPEIFLNIASSAASPNTQFQTLLAKYEKGNRDTSLMRQLLDISKAAGNQILSERLAIDYFSILREKKVYTDDALYQACNFPDVVEVQKYISSYNKDVLSLINGVDLASKVNLTVANAFSSTLIFAEGSKGKFFHLFYKSPSLVDSIINYPGFSEFYIETVITNEEIKPELEKSQHGIVDDPKWKVITKKIRNSYGEELANGLVERSKIDYYRDQKDFGKMAQAIETIIGRNSPQQNGFAFSKAIGGIASTGNDAIALNYLAWDIFELTGDKQILEKALRWSDLSIQISAHNINSHFYDTKANILYRLGKVDAAIALEQKALEANQQSAIKYGLKKGDAVDRYSGVIEKMQRGQPTWPIKKTN